MKYILWILYAIVFVESDSDESFNTSMLQLCSVDYENNEEDPTREEKLNLWPNPARIPYELDSNLKSKHRAAFQEAIDQIHRVTCLRFRPRVSSEKAYIHVLMQYNDTGYCGSATFCRIGRKQYVRISYKCPTMDIFVHELGHAICLHHEMDRVDRDEYVNYTGCANPPRIRDSLTSKGHIYDYLSQMQYYCYGCGAGGKPIMEGVTRCASSDGLSVVDADKVNTYYNCKGCHAHRWYRVDTLTNTERRNLINFASQEGDTKPVYMCRGYLEGHIIIGTYLRAGQACWVATIRFMYKLTKHIQLFGLSNGQNSITNTTSGYYLHDPQRDSNYKPYAIRAGRRADAEILYAGVTAIKTRDNRTITVIGYSRDSYYTPTIYVYDPFHSNESKDTISTNQLRLLSCGSGSRAADLEKTNNYFYVKSVQ